MKFLVALIIIGIVIWYINFMSPDKVRKRKEKFDAYAKAYEEKIAHSKAESFKKGESIGHAISKMLSKSTRKLSKR
jgi:poly(3-hydroxyalkanoate) synthetase